MRIDIKDLFKNVKEKEKNDKINRLIKNLYAHGSTECTDYENAVREMERNVLSVPNDEQFEKYEIFFGKMHEGKLDRNSKTIFRIGVPDEMDLFRAFDIYEDDSEEWIKLIDFFFRYKKINEITPLLMEILVLCRIDKRKIFLYLLKRFNELNVVGNLNKVESYNVFLKKYLSAFSSLGYINVGSLFELDGQSEDWNSRAKKVFASLRNRLNELWEKAPIEEIKKDVELMILFLKKNEEVVNAKKPLEEFKLELKIETKTSVINPEIDAFFKRNEGDDLTMESIVKKLGTEYSSGVCRAVDVIDILDEFKKQKK